MSAGTRRLHLLSLLAVAAAVLAAGPALAASPTIENGGFETNSLKGWTVSASKAGKWKTYHGTFTPQQPPKRHGVMGPVVPKPPRGKYAALSKQGDPSTMILYQDFKVPPKATLKLITYYLSLAPLTDPADLDAEDDAADNQQYRIDLMKPGADIRSVNSSDILKPLFQTKLDDPQQVDPHPIETSLKSFAGRKVRLRFALTVNRAPLYAGVDGVKVKTSH